VPRVSIRETIEAKLQSVERYKTEPVKLTDWSSRVQAEQFVEMLRDLYENGKKVLVSDLATQLLKDGYSQQIFLDYVADLISDSFIPKPKGQTPKQWRVRERKALEEAYPLIRRAELEDEYGLVTKIRNYIYIRYGIEPRSFERLMRDYRSWKLQDEILDDFERSLTDADEKILSPTTGDK